MNLVEVTTLMDWILEHRIDQYVQIDPLRDAILDLFEKATVEDIVSPLLNEEEDYTNG